MCITEFSIVTVLKTVPVLVKMLLVACQFLKDFVRIEEPCVSASEVRRKIFATWVSEIFGPFVLYITLVLKSNLLWLVN